MYTSSVIKDDIYIVKGNFWSAMWFHSNSTDCRNLLNYLQDGAENDEIQLKKYALSKVFGRLRYMECLR